MLRVELHAHTSDDPADIIPHSTSALIERAAALGYDALAITLHERQLDLAPWQGQARDRGLVLIPGIERTIQGRHVLLLNFPPAAERIDTFDGLRAFKRQFGGLVIAPHPFYPGRSCLRSEMDRHPDLFDAVEWTWFYTARTRRFNERAADWARAHGVPLVANADVHRLRQLGPTCSLVDADRNVDEHLRVDPGGPGDTRHPADRRRGGSRVLRQPGHREPHQIVAHALRRPAGAFGDGPPRLRVRLIVGAKTRRGDGYAWASSWKHRACSACTARLTLPAGTTNVVRFGASSSQVGPAPASASAARNSPRLALRAAVSPTTDIQAVSGTTEAA